jgi:hypothetical protein
MVVMVWVSWVVGLFGPSGSSAAGGGEDRLHQAGDDVVDVAGHCDARGYGGCEAEELDVAGDRRDRVEDGVLSQARLLGADSLGIAAAEGLVGERAGAAPVA